VLALLAMGRSKNVRPAEQAEKRMNTRTSADDGLRLGLRCRLISIVCLEECAVGGGRDNEVSVDAIIGFE
jgi:hypothetical protein